MERLKAAEISAFCIIMESNMTDKNDLLLPPAFEPVHHSLADWDWPTGMSRALDNTIKVVAPASLRTKRTALPSYKTALCTRDNVQDLPQGQISSWFRTETVASARAGLCFCHQAPLGTTDFLDFYYIDFTPTQTVLRKFVAGAVAQMWVLPNAHPNNTWHRERVTWWISGGARFISLEKWDGSYFVLLGTICTDNDPQNVYSGVNRLGLAFAMTATLRFVWYDETYLLGPA